jgi:hypothetical protein
MPLDPLVSLMNMDSPSNYGGAVDVYKPNVLRNNARTGALSKFLGIPDDGTVSQSDMESAYAEIQAEKDADEARKAEAALSQERLKGEYGLQGERVKGEYGLQTEAAKAKAVEQAKQEGVAAQEQMNNARIDAANSRAQAGQAGTTARVAMTQGDMGQRQAIGQREHQAQLLETGKVAPTPQPITGPLDALKHFIGYAGVGPYANSNMAASQAAALRSQNSQAAAAPGVADVANYYKLKFPGLTGQQLAQQILSDQPDATPEEVQAVFDAIGR